MALVLASLLCLATGCYAAGPGYDVSEQDLEIGGLWTNGNNVAAPSGSLAQASNVSMEREGVVMPRPGFKKHANTNASYVAYRMFPWQGSLLRVNSATTSWWTAPSTEITKTGSTSLGWTANRQRAAESRNNLYLNTSDGVRKLTSTSDVVASLASLPQSFVIREIAVSGASGFCANNSYAAYTVVYTETDANNVVVRSAGLGHAIVQNAAGGARNFTVTVGFGDNDMNVAAGGTLEIYRTRSSTVIPGREFFLAYTHVVTATDVSNGYYTFTDSTADAALGAALYTNDSREGIEGANFRAPMCKDIAAFKGSLFFADTLGPRRLKLKWKDSGDCSGTTSGVLGYHDVAATRTNGSAVITCAASNEIAVGMMLTSGATNWSGTDPVIVTAVNPGVSMTVNKTWGAATDGAPVTLTFSDTIEITGSTLTGSQTSFPIGAGYYGYGTAVPLGGHQAFMQILHDGNTTTRNVAHPDVFAYSTEAYNRRTAGGGTVGSFTATIYLEESRRGAAATLAYATNFREHAYEISNTSYASGAGTALVADDLANGLSYSKKDEPEHVPLPYFDRVGNESDAILRLAPTRDALWIFKEDGLWRLSGVAAPRWRIDPFDPTLRLVSADALTVLDDVVYAWTNKGVVAVSDSGVVPISGPINDQLDTAQRYYTGQASYGVFMASDPPSGNVILAHADPRSLNAYASALYVYNVRTKRWATWDVSGALAAPYHIVYEPDAAGMFVASNTGGEILQQRTSRDTVVLSAGAIVHADYEFSCTVNSVTGTTVTIAGGSGWTPAIGDVLRQSTALYVVTAVTSGTVFDVHTTGVTAAAATGYVAFSSTVKWNPRGAPFTRKRWREIEPAFDNCAGIYTFTSGFATDVSTAESTVAKLIPQGYVTPTSSAEQFCVPRVFVPRDAARSAVLTPRITVAQAASTWRLSGLGIVSDDISTRVSR